MLGPVSSGCLGIAVAALNAAWATTKAVVRRNVAITVSWIKVADFVKLTILMMVAMTIVGCCLAGSFGSSGKRREEKRSGVRKERNPSLSR